MKSKAAQTKPGKLIIELVLELIQTKWHRSQCCGQKRECARVAQTKQVWNDSGGEGAHGHTCDVASPTKNPIMKVTVDVKNAQTTEDTPRTR